MLSFNNSDNNNSRRSDKDEKLNENDCNKNAQSIKKIPRPEFPESRSIKEGVYPAKPTWGK